MATQICVNIGSDNGLLPDGTKPLPEPMSQARSTDIYMRAISLDTFAVNHLNSFENYLSKILFDLPGVKELITTESLQHSP